MPKLPRLTAVLERIGFSLARQSGVPPDFEECRGQKGNGSGSRFENPSPEGLEEHSAGRGAKSRGSGKAAALMRGESVRRLETDPLKGSGRP